MRPSPGAQTYAIAGQPAGAKRLITRYDAEVHDTLQRQRQRVIFDEASGWIALRENRPDEAISHLRRALDNGLHNCSQCLLAALGLGGTKDGEALDAAAQQAHELAKFLRQPALGFTAWVLHTRYSSVVCVGGFDGPGDAECQRLQRQIANLRFQAKNGVDPIGLMPTPMPVEVPRP